jgi:hypothetical protein
VGREIDAITPAKLELQNLRSKLEPVKPLRTPGTLKLEKYIDDS